MTAIAYGMGAGLVAGLALAVIVAVGNASRRRAGLPPATPSRRRRRSAFWWGYRRGTDIRAISQGRYPQHVFWRHAYRRVFRGRWF